MVGGVVMKPPTIITTSWDDGHPLDFRVASMLVKYGLQGTFYVPATAPRGTMTPAQLRDLGSAFEIGAHTLHHTVLAAASDGAARDEIAGSRRWIEDTTGAACVMFCAPEGKFSRRHLVMMRRAGFLGHRSVELSSLAFPRRRAGLMSMPTTVQAFPHGRATLARNAIKRMAVANLWRAITHGRTQDWSALAHALLRDALDRGGVFHLWGHSWELQDTGQWQRLDETLRLIGEVAARTPSLTNGELCRQACVRTARPVSSPQQQWSQVQLRRASR